jgi:multidrug resistance efflux pump
VKVAPQVAGEIVQLPIADNQFVHKGDLLMLIDPKDYSIAVRRRRRRASKRERSPTTRTRKWRGG